MQRLPQLSRVGLSAEARQVCRVLLSSARVPLVARVVVWVACLFATRFPPYLRVRGLSSGRRVKNVLVVLWSRVVALIVPSRLVL